MIVNDVTSCNVKVWNMRRLDWMSCLFYGCIGGGEEKELAMFAASPGFPQTVFGKQVVMAGCLLIPNNHLSIYPVSNNWALVDQLRPKRNILGSIGNWTEACTSLWLKKEKVYKYRNV